MYVCTCISITLRNAKFLGAAAWCAEGTVHSSMPRPLHCSTSEWVRMREASLTLVIITLQSVDGGSLQFWVVYVIVDTWVAGKHETRAEHLA